MATFGNTTIEGSQYTTGAATFIQGWQFNGGPTSGTLQSISFYLSCASPNNVQVAVYGITSGNLIGSSSAQSVQTAGWYTFTVSGTLNDASGNYGIVQANQSGSVVMYYTTGGSGRLFKGSQTYGTWPSTLSFTNDASGELGSAYFTYTTNSGSTRTSHELSLLNVGS